MKKTKQVIICFSLALVMIATCFVAGPNIKAEASTTAGSVYTADMSRWGVQNNNGWYYMYQDILTEDYNEMPFITTGEDFTNCFSVHRVFPYCFINKQIIHPGVNANPVKAFKAPSGGNVTFDIKIGRSAQDQAGSPSLLRVYRENEQIFPADGSVYEIKYNEGNLASLSVTTDLAKNEMVYFVLSCNGSNINGEVRMTESATYNSVNNSDFSKYISAPSYEGFQIRDNADNKSNKDLRFIFSLPENLFGKNGKTANYQITEIGIIINGSKVPAEYLDNSEYDKLSFVYKIVGITPDDFDTDYEVSPYVTILTAGEKRTIAGDTVSACVNDYLSYSDETKNIVTNQVTSNLPARTLSSKQGTITVSPSYVAKSTYHQTRNIISSSVSGNTINSVVSCGNIVTTYDATDNNGIAITQTASVSDGGIGGIGLSVSFSMDYDVILPAWGGIKLTKSSPDAAPYPNDSPRECIEYPLEWDAQMFLIQGDKGGWLVYQDDNATQYKRLWLDNDGTNFNFVIETVPQAPFTDYTSFTANCWKFIAYEGDWTEGAALYKEFATEKFDLDNINASKPEWVDDIQSMVLTDLSAGTMPYLTELAKKTDASKTVLIIPGWRASLYDVNYPDYTAATGIKAYIDQAQKLGFKVFVHANLIGCDKNSSDYLTYNLADDRMFDLSGEPYDESWTSSYSVDFWLMNPASTDWQNLLISRLVEVYETLGVDGFHLDQSCVIYNNGTGLVNGKTIMQGVVELEKRLAEALPNCGFSGEGSNEINCRYANFLQRAPYGINSSTGTSWSLSKISQIMPVDTFLFADTARLYHYPAMPNPGNESGYIAWYLAGLRLGALPTVMRSSYGELASPNIAGQLAISLNLWYQENNPVINYSRWTEDDGFIAFRTSTGRTVYWNLY